MAESLRPIVVLGPTAGGKSELAVALAEQFQGQILGADSMQIYRHMDAGTAKPGPSLRARIPHHLIDIVDPTDRFTVADWLAAADRLIEDLAARGRRAVVVGGTNLYIKALLEGLFDGPGVDEGLRRELAVLPAPELHRRLTEVDPQAAQRIHPNDQKRLTRALEVFTRTGTPISRWQQQWQERRPEEVAAPGYRHNPILVGLQWETPAINRRINARVRQMFFPGGDIESLPDEVKRLSTAGMLGEQARQALGYRQVLDHLEGRGTLDDAFEQTKIQTRRFAKTQRTWLRRFRGVHWVPATEAEAEVIAAEATHLVSAEISGI